MSRHSSFYSPSPSKTPPSHSKAAEYPTPSRSVLSRSAIETSQRATDDAKNELHRTRILLASALKELDHYKRKSATVLDEHDKSFKILVQERAFIYLESERAYFLNRLKALWGVQQRLRCKTRTFKCWRLAASQAAQIRRMQVILVNRVQRDQGMQLKSSAMMCLRTNTWSQSPHVMEDFAAMVKGFGLWRNCAHRESKAKVEGALEEAVKLGEDLTHDRKHLHKMTHNMFHVSVARMKNKNLKTRLFWQWMSHLATRRQQTRKLSQAGRLYRKKLALRSLQRWLLLLRRETARRLVLLATWGLVVHRRSLAGEGSDRDVLELVTGTMGMEGDSCLRGRAGSEEAAQRRSLLGWRKQVRWTRRARIVLCMLRSEQLTCFYMWKVLVSCLMRARRYKLQGVMTCWSEGSKSAHLRRVWNESYVDKVSIRRHRQRLQRVSLMGWAQVNRNMHVRRRQSIPLSSPLFSLALLFSPLLSSPPLPSAPLLSSPSLPFIFRPLTSTTSPGR